MSDLLDDGSWPHSVRSLIARVGPADVPVLLRGETGVGKEVVARQLHAFSKRADRAFVKVNCAALPSELVESELFGYEKGAFTGAFRNTPGRFEMANRGTILLDEIGDMDLKLQAKLLQVLQDHEFHRLGSSEKTRVDVRVMAASHCDFQQAIRQKRFREDLYYRLNIVELSIPPLRNRRDEILPLCQFFIERHSTPEWPALDIPPLLRQVLLEYDWPGNVRELENLVRKYLVFRSPGILVAEIRQRTVGSKTVHVPIETSQQIEHPQATLSEASDPWNALPLREKDVKFRKPEGKGFEVGFSLREECGPTSVAQFPVALSPGATSTLLRLDSAKKAAEAETILNVLQSTRWNRKQAAKILNIDYKALLYKMKKLGIGERGTAAG